MKIFYIICAVISVCPNFGVKGQSNKNQCNYEEEMEIINQIRIRLKRLESALDTRQENCGQGQEKAGDKEKTKAEESQTPGGGAVYVRWGSSACPGNGTELIYEGFVGGASIRGGAANALCMPKEPSWGTYDAGVTDEAMVSGAEYEDNTGRAARMFGKYVDNNDMPCAVCRSTGRSSTIMIPARNVCSEGWNLEYWGYLMSGYFDARSGSEYICVNHEPEFISGGEQNFSPAKEFYLVEARCGGSMKCPPYVDGRELTCAVCTK